MSAAPASSDTTRWFTPLRLIALATVVALLAASQQYFVSRLQGDPMPVALALVLSLPFWYLWAAFAPVVAWFVRRFPIERQRLALRMASHVGFAFILSVVHSVLHVAVALALKPILNLPIPDDAGMALIISLNWLQMSMNLLAYGGILGVTYAVDFYRRLRDRELLATQLREQLAQAQFHALRMQLNPHFLFNAMNTIAMLVRQQENTEAVRMLAGLSDLLRYVLEETRTQEVPLQEELGFLERYLAIEQVRFHDRLNVQIHNDADILDAQVPNLILQPLVENAIRHGIAGRVGAGRVEISARRDDGTLILQVRDDGPGLRDGAAQAGGVGLQNTRARLAQLYGEKQRLELRNAEGNGVVVTITMPYHTAPQEAESVRP